MDIKKDNEKQHYDDDDSFHSPIMIHQYYNLQQAKRNTFLLYQINEYTKKIFV